MVQLFGKMQLSDNKVLSFKPCASYIIFVYSLETATLYDIVSVSSDFIFSRYKTSNLLNLLF